MFKEDEKRLMLEVANREFCEQELERVFLEHFAQDAAIDRGKIKE